MDDQRNEEEPLIEPKDECSLNEHGDLVDSISLSVPNLKSSLGTRMGKAAKMPVLMLISNSAAASSAASKEHGENSENAAAETVVQMDVHATHSFGTQQKPEAIARVRWPHSMTLLLAVALVFSVGAFAGFLARGDSGNASALEEQKRANDDAAARLKAQDQRLFAREAEAEEQIKEYKRLLEQVEAKRQMDVEDLIDKVDEALKKAEASKRLAEDAETKRQEAQNELEKATSFVTPPLGESYSWPPDPPKVVAPSIPTVESASLRQKQNHPKGARKRRAPSLDAGNN